MVADVSTVSTLLPYCDAMLIDNECRALLSDIPKDHKPVFGAKVFSLNIKEEFLQYLKDIRNEASAEHLQLVEEVYGKDWLTPYRTMYVEPKAEAAEKPKSEGG